MLGGDLGTDKPPLLKMIVYIGLVGHNKRTLEATQQKDISCLELQEIF